MSAELSFELARRAAVHAALADPARLQITDTLLAGDASPSELAALLGLPSNLLAHHLHVLEQAGVITRRSKGDRRRRPAPAAAAPAAAAPHRRRPARRRPGHHRVRPGPRRTRPRCGAALVGPRSRPGWRPRQLRHGADPAHRPRRTARTAPGRRLLTRIPGYRTGLRRSRSRVSRQRP